MAERAFVLKLGLSGIEVEVGGVQIGVVGPTLSQDLARAVLERWPDESSVLGTSKFGMLETTHKLTDDGFAHALLPPVEGATIQQLRVHFVAHRPEHSEVCFSAWWKKPKHHLEDPVEDTLSITDSGALFMSFRGDPEHDTPEKRKRVREDHLRLSNAEMLHQQREQVDRPVKRLSGNVRVRFIDRDELLVDWVVPMSAALLIPAQGSQVDVGKTRYYVVEHVSVVDPVEGVSINVYLRHMLTRSEKPPLGPRPADTDGQAQ